MTAGSLKANFFKAKFIAQQGYITEVQFVNMFMPDGEKLLEKAIAASDAKKKQINEDTKKRLSIKPDAKKGN